MRLNFEEAALINSLFQDLNEVPTRDYLVTRLENAKENTVDSGLVEITEATISKLNEISVESYNEMISNLPVDIFTEY